MHQEYNGKVADVWSVGVSLYVLLTGTFPFKRPEDSKANNVRFGTHVLLTACLCIPHSAAQNLGCVRRFCVCQRSPPVNDMSRLQICCCCSCLQRVCSTTACI